MIPLECHGGYRAVRGSVEEGIEIARPHLFRAGAAGAPVGSEREAALLAPDVYPGATGAVLRRARDRLFRARPARAGQVIGRTGNEPQTGRGAGRGRAPARPFLS